MLEHASESRVQGDREAMRQILAEAFALCRERDSERAITCSGDMLSHLCAEALLAGIETETVKRLVTRRGLAAVGPHVLAWPFPIRIYTLGRFSLVRNGLPVTFAGKAPRRALEMLQALIALGGRGVHASALTRAVWPDECSADIRKLFDNTLHRLRGILGSEEALTMQNGTLSLESRCCWVDSWAFERLARTYTENATGSAEELTSVLGLYRGQFLNGDMEHGWALPYRDRLHRRFHRVVLAEGSRLEAAGRWAEAAQVYERGLDLDSLAEPFYQRLMVCHRERQAHAAAVLTYRRCCELLSIVLGVRPSPETEQIRRTLGVL